MYIDIHIRKNLNHIYIHVKTGDSVCEHFIACIIPVSLFVSCNATPMVGPKASHLSILCVKQAMCPWPTGATSRRFSRNMRILGRYFLRAGHHGGVVFERK